jgi:hypothetical protein
MADLNIQVLPEGFGSYLQGVLPDNIATAAGAFSASMQQIKNIQKINFEKFAQVVASLELTTAGLNLVNGTNVPTDTTEAEAGLALIALGSGPYGTYTFSDFFGCMSGLTYDWTGLQTAITNIQTSALQTIYSNLYAATQGPTLGLDTAVQAQIDLVNDQILAISTANPTQAAKLNIMWKNTSTQLNIEQRARNTGLSPLPDPRTGDLYPYPTMLYSFTDLIPSYAKQTQPNMASQTLEAISDLTKNAGQSIVAEMRADRNQARLSEVGVTPDNNIPDSLSQADQATLLGTGVVANSSPSFPYNVSPVGYYDPVTENFYANVVIAVTNASLVTGTNTSLVTGTNTSLVTGTPTIIGAPNSQVALDLGLISPSIPNSQFFEGPAAGGGIGSQGGGPIVPGSLAGSPYKQLIPLELNPTYTSGILLPTGLSVQQAIEQVITCNCDCWVQ